MKLYIKLFLMQNFLLKIFHKKFFNNSVAGFFYISEYIHHVIFNNFFMNRKEKDLLLNLGNEISKKRKELKMSQSDLSEKTGIDRSYISMVERGETNITYLKLVKIGEILNINLF